MKFFQIFLLGILICLLVFSCRNLDEKTNTDPIPSTENKGVDEIKKTHREIDSIKSLKKKKSKRFDTLKPGVATLELSEE